MMMFLDILKEDINDIINLKIELLYTLFKINIVTHTSLR